VIETAVGFVIILFLIVIPVACVFCWFFLKPKRDIIETQETTARIIICITFMLLCFILLAGGGVALFVWLATMNIWKTLLGLPLVITPIFPFFFAIISYLWLPDILGRYFEAWLPAEKAVQDKVFEVAKTLGLKKLPHVRLSVCRKRYTPPTVFAKWGTMPTLVLPKDYAEAIQQASNNEEGLAENLDSFVISHELSHVKNGDCQFMSWVTALSCATKWWIAAILLGTCISVILLGIKVIILFLILLWVCGCLFGLFWVTYCLISNHREYLADARTISYMPPENWKCIFQRESENISPIEQLFLYFGMRRRLSQKTVAKLHVPFLGVGLRKIVGLFVKIHNIFTACLLRLGKKFKISLQRHPDSGQRRDALLRHKFLGELKPHISKTSTILLFAAAGFTLLIGIVAITTTARPVNEFASTLAATVFTVDVALYTAVVLCLPLHNMTTNTSRIRKLFCGYLSRCTIGCVAQFLSIVLLCIPAVLIKPVKFLQALTLFAGLCLFFATTTCIITTILAKVVSMSHVWKESKYNSRGKSSI